ncbi:MAG: calcium-translocating P-type ATPase, SERCA-type [Candidatus Woesearchaeota archaeon]|nr:calcium-translocating P-type ATPase, SERCA-type [Candidatus Woesearchaeota archaeon]
MEFYKASIRQVYKELGSSEKGLTSKEAKARLEKYGLNKIEAKKKISPFLLFIEQFNDPVIWVLIGALIISSIIGYYEYKAGNVTLLEVATESIVIGAIVILNAVIGFVQEFRAEKAIEALKRLASLKAVVLRDGKQVEVNAEELVPGDIILITAGEKIPADSRLITLNSLQAQEAALTGESLPVKKEITEYKDKLQLGDQKNMVFSGTVINDGKATAIVVKTGMETEIGKIARLIESAEETMTPLQEKLEKLGKFLTYLTLSICVLIFAVLSFRGVKVLEALITAVSLAVAAIPEGLPAVVTISLALGVQRMIKKNALIRKLPSVETLGGTTVICTDKTGTLTKNEMTVRKLYVDDKTIDITGSGYAPEGEFSKKTQDVELLLKIGLLNNDARLEKTGDGYKIIGDPTEGALLVSAEKFGLSHHDLLAKHPRTDELLFDSKRKRMTTVHKIDGKTYAYVKGAPDIILNLCTHIMIDGKSKALDKSARERILKANDEFSKDALRVLGFAYKEVEGKDYESKLVFVGLQGMIDPPRDGVKESILKCRTAGIKVVMITGDYMGTAMAIAKELGIEGKSVQGQDLDSIDLEKEVDKIGVYARVDPEHKMRIVEALKKKGHIVAMTGDGVNDAPALKAADIGIAMGISGTDVAKESSHMILTDDNFTSIVNAVEEGRGIFDNIKKFVQYLLSSNLGEILVIFVATLFGMPLPLLPTQILFMNLLTDGLPAVALGVDPAAKDIMKRKPRKTDEGIMTRAFSVKVFYTGIMIAAATLFVFWYAMNYRGETVEHARTLAFTTLVLLQFVRIHIIRSEYNLGMFSNMKLVLAVLISIVLQITIIYTGVGELFFETTVLDMMDWVFIGAVGIALFILSSMFNRILAKIDIQGD